MNKKIVVALSIFTVLFISAWWGNEFMEKRYYVDDQKDRQIELLMIDEEQTNERFKPREYIKIKR